MSDATSHEAPIAFAGGTLDRADPVRTDPARLAAAWADPRARVLLLDGLDPMIEGPMVEGPMVEGPMIEGEDRLATGPVAPGAVLAGHVLLGLDGEGAPVFVSLDMATPEEPPSFPPKVWSLVPLLGSADAALFGTARSLVDWHARHPFCARCGQPTVPAKAGWSRQCGACAAEHFPRVDPVVIMLAEHEGRVLIGRNPRFPPRRFSALAGFVEPGETIEEAVRRELFEEAGVRAGRVDYLMSQPWPFPSQLMIACMAQAQSDAITLDTNELAEAMWVDRETVRQAFDDPDHAPFLPPSTIAIAHHMLRAWLAL
jgi:NAD+ diphosphatase